MKYKKQENIIGKIIKYRKAKKQEEQERMKKWEEESKEKNRKDNIRSQAEDILRIVGDPDSNGIKSSYLMDDVFIIKHGTTNIEIYISGYKVMEYNYFAKKYGVFADSNWTEIITKLYFNSDKLRKEKIKKEEYENKKFHFERFQPIFDNYLMIEANNPNSFKQLTNLLMHDHIVVKKVNYRNTKTNEIRVEYQIYYHNEKVAAYSKKDNKYIVNDNFINAFFPKLPNTFGDVRWPYAFERNVNTIKNGLLDADMQRLQESTNKTLAKLNNKFR